MNVHEYQAKELLAKHGIAVPAGYPALSVEEAVEAFLYPAQRLAHAALPSRCSRPRASSSAPIM